MPAICEPLVKTELEKHMRSQCVEADVRPNPKSTKDENRKFAVGIQKEFQELHILTETPTRISKKKLIAKDLYY